MKRNFVMMMVVGVMLLSQSAMAFDKQDWLGEWKGEGGKTFVIDDFDGELILTGKGATFTVKEKDGSTTTWNLYNPGWKKMLSKDYSKLKLQTDALSALCIMKSRDRVECTGEFGQSEWKR